MARFVVGVVGIVLALVVDSAPAGAQLHQPPAPPTSVLKKAPAFYE
jgi:hypothetical protein